jgi:hypothetical protein
MTFRELCTLVMILEVASLSQSGEEVHCIGQRAHLLRFNVEGEPNDGSSWKGVKSALVSIEPSPSHAAHCEAKQVSSTPSGDKKFCYGVNQDSSCAAAKEDLPLEHGFQCKNCFVSATADLFYNLNYSMTKLYSVEVGLKDMHLRAGASLHTTFSGSKTVKGSKILEQKNMTVIDKLIGCPVCLKAKIVVGAPTSIDYDVDMEASDDITVGADLDINLGDRSIKWDHVAGWTPSAHQRTVDVKPILDLGTVQAETDVKLSLDTSLQVNIDDIIWYHTNLKPSFPAKCSVKGGVFQKTRFCMSGDADLTLGHEADLHWRLLTFKANHHWGPTQDDEWSKSGVLNMCKDFGNSSSVAHIVV